MERFTHLLIIVLAGLVLASGLAQADGPPVQWQKTFGGGDYDYGRSVQQTVDGGYIIAGSTYSFGASGSDVYLIKTNTNGNSQWQKTFGGIDYEQGWSVQQTRDAGYIIAGLTMGSVLVPSDVYLIKTDRNGNRQWQEIFWGSRWEAGYSVQETKDGYIVAGHIYSPFTLPSDVYLIQTSSTGILNRQKTFGGGEWDAGYSVQQTTDGGYIIAGLTCSFGAGSSDVYLIKTDSYGNSRWQKTFGGSDSDSGYSVQQTADGGYIIAGRTRSFGAGDYDVYLIKTDPNGNSQWQKTFGGGDYDEGRSVQQTRDGGYIIAGDTRSFGAGGSDVYLIKTDPYGESQWQKTFGGGEWDYGYSVQQTTDGGYIIAGETESFGAGGYDVYLIKLCSDGTLPGDLNCDGSINFKDLTILAGQWLQPPVMLSADIAPSPNDGKVNLLDFCLLAEDWHEGCCP